MKVEIENWLAVFVGVATLTLATLVDFVDADLVVPTGHCEKVCGLVLGGREGKIGDGVGGGITQGDVTFEVACSLRAGRRGRSGTSKEP